MGIKFKGTSARVVESSRDVKAMRRKRKYENPKVKQARKKVAEQLKKHRKDSFNRKKDFATKKFKAGSEILSKKLINKKQLKNKI